MISAKSFERCESSITLTWVDLYCTSSSWSFVRTCGEERESWSVFKDKVCVKCGLCACVLSVSCRCAECGVCVKLAELCVEVYYWFRNSLKEWLRLRLETFWGNNEFWQRLRGKEEEKAGGGEGRRLYELFYRQILVTGTKKALYNHNKTKYNFTLRQRYKIYSVQAPILCKYIKPLFNRK